MKYLVFKFRFYLYFIFASLLFTNFVNAQHNPYDILTTNQVYSGEANSQKSGNKWQFNLVFKVLDKTNNLITGEIEWPSLNSVNLIKGNVEGKILNFSETEFIKKGGAVINTNYSLIENGDFMTGSWNYYNKDNGEFSFSLNPTESDLSSFSDLQKRVIQFAQNNSVVTGIATSDKSNKEWPFNLIINSFDKLTGKIVGQIEWTTLNSINRIIGNVTSDSFTFSETDYIKKGGAVLGTDYVLYLKKGKITGSWKDGNSDFGGIEIND